MSFWFALIWTRPQQDTTAGYHSGRPQRETTAGDLSGRPQRETSAGDLSGRPQQDITAGDLSGRPQQDITAGDHSGRPQRETSAGDHRGQGGARQLNLNRGVDKNVSRFLASVYGPECGKTYTFSAGGAKTAPRTWVHFSRQPQPSGRQSWDRLTLFLTTDDGRRPTPLPRKQLQPSGA